MEKIAFILDFDHTLVDSNMALKAAKKNVSKALKINESVFEETYNNHKGQYGFHFPFVHITSITKDNNLMNKGLKAYHSYYREMKKAVFKDSIDSIKKLKRWGSVIIFSFGEREHQLRAIFESGLNEYCDMIRIAEKKSIDEIEECIKKLNEKPSIIFSIGDRPSDAKSFKEYGNKNQIKVVGIRIRRPQGKYVNEKDIEKIVDKEYINLAEFVIEFEKGKYNIKTLE